MFLLNSEQLLHYWPEMLRGLEEIPGFIERFDEQYLLELALRGHLCFWTLGEGKIELVLATRILDYPRGRALQVCAAFGRRVEEFIPRIDAMLERVAALQGARWIEVVGRPGWARLLRSRGFETYQICLVREVRGPIQ